MIIIYKYRNKINNKVYIGQTCQTLEERAGKNGYRYNHCLHFYSAICKYGWENFEPEILEYIENQDIADDRETFYIKYYNSIDFGYNIDKGGHIEKRRSEETKKKISESLKSKNNNRSKEVIINGVSTGYTIGEYSKIINRSQSTVRNWCKYHRNGYSYKKFNS